MEKIDFKKEFKHLYTASATSASLIEIPPINFIMIDGSGDPNKAREYQEAIETLYSISYTIKFMIKKEKGIDHGVMPLEGLWWTDNMSQFSITNKDIWKWTAMMMQPKYVSEVSFKDALAQVEKKKKLPALRRARFQSFYEGLSAQIMHIGPFSAEGPTIEKLHSFIKDEGYAFDGLVKKHHEIYLSDIRKSTPEKWKTIIRQPVEKGD
jgi:hypothetical protein